MSEEKIIYWLGPGVLSWKKNGEFVQPNQIIPEEVLEFLGEKRIKFFFDKKMISNLTPALARRQLGKNNPDDIKKLQAEIAALKTAILTLTEVNAELDQKNKELSEAKTNDSSADKKLEKKFSNLETAYQTKCKENNELKIKLDELISENKILISDNKTLAKYNDKLHKRVGKLEKKLTGKGISFNEEDREKEGDDMKQNDGNPLVDLQKPAGPGPG